MKMSGRVLTVTLFAVATAGYAEIGSAGPHGGAMGFHGAATNGFAGTGSLAKGIAATGSSQRGVFITGSRLPYARNAIAAPRSQQKAVIGTGTSAVIGTGTSAVIGTGLQQKRDIQ